MHPGTHNRKFYTFDFYFFQISLLDTWRNSNSNELPATTKHLMQRVNEEGGEAREGKKKSSSYLMPFKSVVSCAPYVRIYEDPPPRYNTTGSWEC